MATELYKDIIESIRKIDPSKTNFGDDGVSVKVLEEQKIYFWIRVYLSEEIDTLPGDSYSIVYNPTGDKLEVKFICFGKDGINKDYDNEIAQFEPDDNKKVLCLMVDENEINNSDEIPFIRTLFKTSKYYEYQLLKRSDLILTNLRNNEVVDYYDIDFKLG